MTACSTFALPIKKSVYYPVLKFDGVDSFVLDRYLPDDGADEVPEHIRLDNSSEFTEFDVHIRIQMMSKEPS